MMLRGRDVIGVVMLLLVAVGPCHADNVQTEDDATDYLSRYGFGRTDSDVGDGEMMADLRQPNNFHRSISHFQRFAGIPQTGVLDADTIAMMNMPRCGVSDFGSGAGPTDSRRRRRRRRRRRYVLQGSRWDTNALTYRLQGSKTSDRWRTNIQRAFKIWSDITPLTFAEVKGRPDIEILFAKRYHGDGVPFDGRGGTLAHAFFPQYGGDAHFDEDEYFTEGESSGINFYQVAAHEFGHSLGLGHSEVRSALMAPFYRGYQPRFKLSPDDINAIQMLYGKNSSPTNPSNPPPVDPTRPPTAPVPDPTPSGAEPCQNPKFDAIFTHDRYGTYAFVGNQYLKLSRSGIEIGYPRDVSSTFADVTNVDAAFAADFYIPPRNSRVSYVFLFNGAHITGYELPNMDKIFDNRDNSGIYFSNLPSNIDAIFRWSRNGRIYVIKGDDYYRLTSQLQVDSGYPRKLSVWNLPVKHVDAVVQYENKRTYFFSGTEYYRYNDRFFQPDRSYPRRVDQWWLGCRSGSLQSDGPGAPPSGGESEDADLDEQFINVKTVHDEQQTTAGATPVLLARWSNNALTVWTIVACLLYLLVT